MAKRTPKQPSSAQVRRKVKFPAIDALPEKERQDLERKVREWRASYRRLTLDDVVDAALTYHAETERCDPVHDARLSQREETLRRAIKEAYEAMHPGPITDFDLAMTKSLRAFGRD